ncbi:MAG TPA: VOC family protein [Candidatus Sulfotelmatobacter sp.]|jgi:PhnB protein|nr:VOC family protein [Candidatus Sulfotelmatobacter sp.]
MTATWKPETYNSVSVYVVTYNAQRVIDFLKFAFDGTPLRRFDAPDGKIMHAEVRLDDTVVMLADASSAYPAIPAWLHVYVPDAQATYKRALAAGGISVQEPVQKQGDLDLRGGVKDPCGNTWWISTQLAV